ncbi:uncharacterized protein BX663DRAFT_526874 [Cokeromyces recurvatus]|uniref:uncharacterized protein n=1 Tax=Cokeromyces recurvatus TaxID=90255 RepID=UPI0022204324|nr:uncharacterized protein BX663DRAFT_526874 [Cokeromyces recurvatus]KAI7897905.1 hypothetical protein BX663DRAFT_526874 [Cokeromyces recurvatus]
MPLQFKGAPKCPRCEKSVYMAEQVIGPGGPWHKNCLTCKECNKRLDSTTLTEKNNEAYCKTCYNRKWGPKGYGFAGGASFLSTESKLPSEILKENYLPSGNHHLTRNVAEQSPPLKPVDNKTEETILPSLPNRPQLPPRPSLPSRPTNHEQQSYIKHHTDYVPRKFNFGSQPDICVSCQKPVYAAELVLGAGNKYHKMCLKCSQCGKRLDSTNMVDKDYDPYCRGCYSKLFGPKGYGYGNLLTPEGATR